MKYYKEINCIKELPRAGGYYRSNNEPSFYNVIEDQWYNQRGEQIAVKHWLKEVTIEEVPSDDKIKEWAYDESEQNINGDFEMGVAMGKELGAIWLKSQLKLKSK